MYCTVARSLPFFHSALWLFVAQGLTVKEVKSAGDKIDWPSRFIKVMFDNTTPSGVLP